MMNTRSLLAAGAASVAMLAVPHQAFANSLEPGATAVPADAAGGADQQSDNGDDPSRGDVIIVTARHRAETAQAVPLAISVIKADSIESTGNFNVNKLQQIAPTLQVYSSNPRNTAVNIRGLGVPFGLTSDGFEQGVGIYVDDVYNSRVAAAVFDFLDVEQVEVLRGPQGTLYGKNTTAGAINITTNKPTFKPEVRAEFSGGNLDFYQGKLAVSGPLTDRLAARIAGSFTSRRGTIYNVRSGDWINGQDNKAVRAELLWNANDDLTFTLSGDFNYQNAKCCGTVFVRTGTTQRSSTRQYAALVGLYNAANPANPYTVPSTNAFDRLTDLDAPLQATNKIGGVSLKAKWDIGGGTLTSITAWRFWDWKPQNDRDFTGLSIVSASNNPSQQNQYSQELRYNYSGRKVDVVVGAFGFNQRIDTQGVEQQGRDASLWNLTGALSRDPTVLDGLTARNVQYLKSTSAALYGQVSYKLTDALTIQPGLRVNYDKKSGFYQRRVFDGTGAEISCFNPTPTSGTRLAAQCGIYTPQLSAPSASDWNFSYDINVNYKIARDVLFYATYAKSFKTIGINQNGLPLDSAGVPIAASGTVKPESVHHYEVGLKTQFFDRRATFNLAAFRTDIDNFQVTVTNGQYGVLRGYLANADEVRSQGVEADLKIRPSDRFSAYANAAYTDATYRKFVDAPCPPELSGGTSSPANCNISGQQLPGVSKWSVSFGAEGNLPVSVFGKEGQVYLGVDGNARSRFSSNPSPSIYTVIKGYALVNFRTGFRREGLDIYGWVRNAFDRNYYELLQVAPSNVGLIAGQPGDPRTFGGTVKVSF